MAVRAESCPETSRAQARLVRLDEINAACLIVYIENAVVSELLGHFADAAWLFALSFLGDEFIGWDGSVL